MAVVGGHIEGEDNQGYGQRGAQGVHPVNTICRQIITNTKAYQKQMRLSRLDVTALTKKPL